MTIKRMSTVDRAFLAIDSAEVAAHVAVLAQFSPPQDAPPDYLQRLVAELRAVHTFAPPFNHRLTRSGLRRAAPAWEVLPDEQVDLDYHFRHSALPKPGSERDLGVLISRLHSRPLDPTKPLWECHLIEGLERGRFALYFKVHHSMMDGVNGAQRVAMMLSPDAAEHVVRPPWSIGPPKRKRTALSGTGRSLAGRAREGATTARALGSVTVDLFREGFRPSDPAMGVPFVAPSSARLNGRIGRQRRFATQSYPFDRVRAVAKAVEVTINDVFLAICAGGLRRYLGELGELTSDGLVTGAPVSIRVEGDERSNAIAFVTVKLFTDIEDPVERIKAICRSSTLAKDQLKGLPQGAANQFGLLTQGPYLAQIMLGLAGRVRPPYNVVISNVPGPQEPRYLAGARLDELFPVSVVLHGQALNITVMSTAGRFNVGFIGDRDTLPHLQRLAVYTGEALAELEAGLGIG